MKKIIFPLLLTFCLSSTVFANEIQDEALDSLGTAQDFVKEGNYNKAVDEINYALSKINELTAETLLKFIPEPPKGYSLDNKQSQGVGAGAAIAGNAGATAQYSSPDGSTISLNIAIGGMTGKMASLAAFGSMFAGLGQQTGMGQTTKIRSHGYTGTQIFNANERSGTLTFQVGQKTSVTIDGTNIDSAKILLQIAKDIDFAGLEKNY